MNNPWHTCFAQFPIVSTARLRLRQPRKTDAPALFALMGDERVTRYIGRAPMATMEDAIALIERYQKDYTQQTAIQWVITRHDDESVIGICLLFHIIKVHFRAELGYALRPDLWGQGIISEVLPPIIDYGFTQMPLHSMEAKIDPANGVSRHLLEKMGFAQEAYFHEDFFHPVQQQFTDTAILSLLKRNWQSPQ